MSEPRAEVAHPITKHTVECRSYGCEELVETGRGSWGLCPAHDRLYSRTLLREELTQIASLRLYADETGDEAAMRYADALDAELEAWTADDDHDFLRTDPVAVRQQVGFNWGPYLAWQNESSYVASKIEP